MKKRTLGVAIAVLALAGAASAEVLDLSKPEDALTAMRKIQCSTVDGEPTTYWWTGSVYSRVAGEKDRKLFNYHGMNVRACKTVDDPEKGRGYRQVSRELLIYTDTRTGEILRTWKNPWTGEENEVLHVANDPVNFGPSFTQAPWGPYRLPATFKDGHGWMHIEVPLFYTNPLGGDYQKYVGGTYQAIEMFGFFFDEGSLLSPDVDAVPNVNVSWSRMSQWLPWMEMGSRAGQMMFHGTGMRLASWDDMPEMLKDEIRANYPIYREPPPLDDERPNMTSWIQFKRKMEAAKRGRSSLSRLNSMPSVQVRNPRTGELDYEFAPPAPEEVRSLVFRLRAAQPEWEARGVDGRIEVMRRWKDEIFRRKPAIQKALSVDTGRWRLAATEIDAAAWGIEGWCAQAPEILRERSGRSRFMPEVTFRSQYVPYPVLGVISPWNFPVTLSLIDVVPALLAGCAAAVKPSEVTPRFIEPLAETIEAVPELAAVLSVFAGAGETGAALVDCVDAVCFTGSIETGRKVAAAAARRFIPAFLELGGKDPAVILASADLGRAAEAVLRGSVSATGQVCFSIERIYVDATVHDAFVDRLVERAEELELNYPDIHTGHIGPLIFAPQAETIAEHLADAVARGANIRCGGEIEEHGGGKWIRPTVVTGADHGMKLMTDETFGPVMPVMPFADVQEAVALANGTRYGLSAAVFAATEEEAVAVSRRIDAGAVSINDTALTRAILQDAEKNSFNCSGLGGSRMGPASLTRFLRKKALIVNTGEPEALSSLDEAGAD